MATNTTNISVNVQSNIDAEIAKAKTLRQLLMEASMASGRTAGPTAAAKAGLQNSKDSNTARGIGGVTGAAGRDFAAQAQGLGGLVHVYATFAANLFAISTAFNALSKAADTTNMVRGLDQLGAASGRSLGTLSQKLVQATGGALSLRDAMESVAKGSSAGLTKMQMETLASVATKASQALGIAMPDAMSRLTRGISKLEPELLDELGLFTKIGPATEKYALSIGKSVSSLTDFERRQAFANAVLQEGVDKFGQLNLEANPYAKILAGTQNLLQVGLELVNKVAAPLLNLLSSSPTALGTAIAGLAALLLKQAIPAIGMFRQNARIMQEEAAARVLKLVEDQKEAAAKMDAVAAMQAEKQFQMQKSIQDRVRTLQGYGSSKLAGKDVVGLIRGASPFALSKEDIATIDARAAELEAKDGARYKRQAERLRSYLDEVKRLRKESEDIGQAASDSREARDTKNFLSYTNQLERRRQALEKLSTKRNILTNVADTAATLGPVEAFKDLTKSTADAKLSAISKGFTLVQGTASIATSAVTSFVSAFQPWLMIISLAGAALAILDNVLENNVREIDAFSEALKGNSEAVTNVTRTLDSLGKVGGANTIAGISALSNAMTELSDATEQVISKSEKALRTMTPYGNAKNNVKKLFGEDIKSDLAEQLIDSIQAAIDIADRAGISDTYRNKFKSILGVDQLDSESISKAVKRLNDFGNKDISKNIRDVSLIIGESANKLNQFKSSSDAAYKSYQEFIQSTANNNPLFKLGETVQRLGEDMSKIFDSLSSDIDKAFREIAANPQKFSVLGKEFVDTFVSIQPQFSKTIKAIDDIDERIVNLTARQKSVRRELENMPTTSFLPGGAQRAKNAKSSELDEINIALSRAKEAKISIDTKSLSDARELFINGMSAALIKGGEFIAAALGQAAEKAKLTIAKANLGALSGPRAVREATAITDREISIQLNLIDTNIEVIRSQERLTAAIEASTAAVEANKPENAKNELVQARAVAAMAFSRKLSGESVPTGLSDLASKLFQQRSQDLDRRLASQNAAKTELSATRTANQITGKRSERAAEVKELQDIFSNNVKILGLEKTRKDTLNSILNVTTEKAIEDDTQLESEIRRNRYFSDLEEIQRRISEAAKVNNKAELTYLYEQERILETNYDIENDNSSFQKRLKSLNLELDLLNKKLEIEKASNDLSYNRLIAQNEITSSTEAEYAKLYDAQDSYTTLLKYEQELRKASLELTKAESDARAAFAAKEAEILERKKVAGPGADTSGLDRELERQRQLRDISIGNAQVQYDKTLALANLNKTVSDIQDGFNAKLNTSVSLAEALGIAFGSVGESLGGAVKALVELSVADEKYNKDRESRLEKIKGMTPDSKEDQEARKELAKLDEKYNKTQLSGITKAAGETKKMFKEKTAAHKAFAALERVTAAMSAAIQMKELAITIAGIPAKIAGGVSKLFDQGGWAGFAGAAAFLAMMGSLGFGGGSGPDTPGMSSEDRQKSQGTGQSWVNGKLQENGGGVFGDAEAKSESIKNSLEIIRDNSIEGLAYDSKMLEALQGIEKAIGSSAKTLYSVKGLRSGSIFGNPESSIKTSGIMGLFGKSVSKEITDSGIILKGTFGQLAQSADGLVQAYETIKKTTKRSGFLGIGSSTKVSYSTTYKNVGDDVEKEISSIFKNAQQLFIVAGDKLGMTAESVITKLNKIDVGQAFASLRGLKGEELEKEFSAVVGNLLDSASSALFGQMEKYRKFGEGLLETVIRVIDGSEKVKVALKSVGIATSKMVPLVVDFGNTVGAVGNVVSNVINSTNTIVDAFNFDVTEALIDGAGGLTEFTKQITYFRENFLTEAEQLAPVIDNVTSKLSEMGYGFVDTRDEFKQLVRSLDLTTEYGRKTYQTLMDLAPAFAEVYQEAKKVLTIEELRKSQLQQTIEILKLEGKTGEALILQRLEELSQMDDRLKGGQLYLYALQDEADIKAKLKTAYDKETSAIKNNISALKSSLKTLQDYRKTLLTGNDSILTPLQKYEQTKAEAERVAAIAVGIATTDAEKQAQQDAINQLPSVAGAFLEASRTMFASSGQYVTDFNSVLAVLESTSTYLDDQLSEAELQLKTLEENTVILDIIKDNTKTTAELLGQYANAQAIVAQASQGYQMNLNMLTAEMLSNAKLSTDMMAVMMESMALLATNLSPVAANAPTFNTATTTQTPLISPEISTAYNINAANDALLREVQALKDEVAALRADQQQQTGDLIATNITGTDQLTQSIQDTTTADRLREWFYKYKPDYG